MIGMLTMSVRRFWSAPARQSSMPPQSAAIREFATGRLAHYKIPRYVIVVEEFPMTVTGKIRKVEMRARSVELLGLDDSAKHA